MFSTWCGLCRFNDLEKRTASNKVLRDKAFNIAKNSKYNGYQRGLASMTYNFFDKKSTSLLAKSVSGSGVNVNVKPSKQLAEELHKPIIKKFRKEQFILDLKTIFGELI